VRNIVPKIPLWMVGVAGTLFIFMGLYLGGNSVLQMHYFAPGSSHSIVTPASYHHKHQGEFFFEVHYQKRALSSATFRVIPDDKLLKCTVNGVAVALDSYSKRQLGNWKHGFVLNLSEYLQSGDNTIKFYLSNHSGPGGLKLYREPGALPYVQYGVMTVGLMLWGLLLAGVFRLGFGQKALLLVTIAVIGIYWIQTPFTERTYDVLEGGGHLDYIEYLVQHHKLPPPGGGWEYHQPPLYYTLGALIYKGNGLLGLQSWDISLQLFSLFSFLIFLVSSASVLKMAFKSTPILLPLTALLFLWPAGIIHSIRLGNDVLLYGLCGVSLYFATIWWQQGNKKAFVWATVFACLGVLTKSTALACFASLGILWVWNAIWPGTRGKLPLKYTLISLALFVLAVAVNLGDNIYLYLVGESQDWLIQNVVHSLNKRLQVGNSWHNWLFMDVPTYLNTPFMSGWKDSEGRQFFLNFFLRSSLYSQWVFRHPVQVGIAYLAGVWLLLLLGMAGLGLWRAKDKLVYHLPWILGAVFAVLALISFRFKLPYACTGDFRYIHFAITGLLLLIGLWVQSIPRGSAWSKVHLVVMVTLAALWVLPALTVVFFLLPL
jgi:hypothetical protein